MECSWLWESIRKVCLLNSVPCVSKFMLLLIKLKVVETHTDYVKWVERILTWTHFMWNEYKEYRNANISKTKNTCTWQIAYIQSKSYTSYPEIFGHQFEINFIDIFIYRFAKWQVERQKDISHLRGLTTYPISS